MKFRICKQGNRPDLTGGGLIRSFGGWTALKQYRKAGIRLKGDERILGDSDFVELVIKSAEESFERKYQLKAKGYDFNQAKEQVAELMGIEPDQVTALINPHKQSVPDHCYAFGFIGNLE